LCIEAYVSNKVREAVLCCLQVTAEGRCLARCEAEFAIYSECINGKYLWCGDLSEETSTGRLTQGQSILLFIMSHFKVSQEFLPHHLWCTFSDRQ